MTEFGVNTRRQLTHMDFQVQASSSEPSQVHHAAGPAHRIECLWWCLVAFAQPEEIKIASTLDQPKMDQFIADSIPLKSTSPVSFSTSQNGAMPRCQLHQPVPVGRQSRRRGQGTTVAGLGAEGVKTG